MKTSLAFELHFSKIRTQLLGLVATCVFAAVLTSCGQAQRAESEAQGLIFWQKQERIKYDVDQNGRAVPERVSRFLMSAEQFGQGVKTYRLGSYQRSMTDCGGFIGQAHRASGFGVALFQFDYDFLNFAGCSDGLKPGDVLLLAYPGRQADHWIMMVDVQDPKGKFNSGKNIIMDVSSDYVDGRPFFKGALSRRQNLLARQVVACRRHRSFDADWKRLAAQLAEDAKNKAVESRSKNPQPEPQKDPADETKPQEANTPTTDSSDLETAKTSEPSLLNWRFDVTPGSVRK